MPAVSGKVCENSVGCAGQRMDSQRISVLKIETDCHVKLSRGRVEFRGSFNCHGRYCPADGEAQS
jgi:hypothetical protein